MKRCVKRSEGVLFPIRALDRGLDHGWEPNATVHGRAQHRRRRHRRPTSPGRTPPTWRPRPRYGVNYLRYWVDEEAGKIFCLVEAPDAEAANTVHREAHGLVADEIYQVSEHD